MPSNFQEYDDNICYEDDFESISEKSNNSSEKSEDIFIKVQKRNKRRNALVVDVDIYGNERCIFGSKGQGTFIYNAVTGYKTQYRVGSADEDLFFSVIDSRAFDKIQEPYFFYFESPEQFERVMGKYLSGGELPQKVKEKWHNKNMIAKKRLSSSHRSITFDVVI